MKGGTLVTFENLLKKINFTSKNIEEELKKHEIQLIDYRNNDIEWKTPLPIFLEAFYGFCIEKQRIPTQQEFLDNYININPELKERYDSWPSEYKYGLLARIYRTYFSLIRDIHLALTLKEKNIPVVYNIVADHLYGIDLIIDFNKTRIGFNLFINSKNANDARTKKENRNKLKVDFPTFDLPLDFSGSLNCNNVFLYSDREINLILEKINKIVMKPAHGKEK